MGFLGLLHYHPGHRARQLRWVVPLVAFLLVAVLTTLAVQYHVSNQAIGAEFFRAHKTISHTGELLRRGTLIGSGVRRALVLACLVPVAAQAAPTMLNQIPTTDLVPERQVSLQLQNGNTEVSGRSSLFHQPELVPQSEFGLPWNLEAGLDVAPSDPPHDYRPILDLKWSPGREDYRVPAVAVGATQLGVGFAPHYFLV